MEYKPLVISCVASQDTRKCLPCATDCSHSPGITFRKSLFSVFPRGTGQQELLWAAELGTVGLVLRTAQHRANAAPSHTHMQVVVVLPLLFHFPFSATLGFAQPGCSEGADEQQGTRVEGSRRWTPMLKSRKEGRKTSQWMSHMRRATPWLFAKPRISQGIFTSPLTSF